MNSQLPKSKPPSSDINLQLVALEFNPAICESSMKTVCQLMIQQEQRMRTIKDDQTPKGYLSCYFYIVNNKVNSLWDQSLLALYEKRDKRTPDSIKGCLVAFCMAVFACIGLLWNVIATEMWPCLKQCLCSLFVIKKYIFCCYCTFLQSGYGSWIQKLMGLSTADYEYNEKKDKLKQSLEQYKFQLNILFWLNFLLFFLVVIFVPINFVLNCSGHSWYILYSQQLGQVT
jgi:hypothetical protein